MLADAGVVEMRRWIGLCMLLFFLGAFSGEARADGRKNTGPIRMRYDVLLTPQDVEQVSGFLGIKQVPKDTMSGADGVVNFALPRGSVILALKGQEVNALEFAKEKRTGSFKARYAFQFKGLGDDAYEGPAQKGNLYVLVFQKGNHWIALSSGLSPRQGKPRLSMEQLHSLAELILKRL